MEIALSQPSRSLDVSEGFSIGTYLRMHALMPFTINGLNDMNLKSLNIICGSNNDAKNTHREHTTREES